MNLQDLHIINRVRQQALEHPERSVLRFKQNETWQDISWGEFQQKLDQLSLALLSQNIGIQDKVGIFAQNMPNWTIVDIATLQLRAITVPIYATNTPKQAEYIINNADVEILFVGDQPQLDAILSVAENCTTLTKIVLMKEGLQYQANDLIIEWNDFIALGENANKQDFEQRIATKNLDDLFTLIYTSGTTGEPKGVMLTHSNLAHQFQSHDLALLPIDHNDVSLAFLPFSHVYERAWSAYMLHRGAIICYLEDTNEVRSALAETQPTLMCAVPRLYEKMYSAIWDKVDKAPKYRKKLFNWAINIGEKSLQRKHHSKWLKVRYKLADKLVLSKLRSLLGGRVRMLPCGGAKLEPSIAEFFHSIGINIITGYGMTETTATISCWEQKGFKSNSIGKVMPNVEIKIGEENEILVRGGIVMKGYYKKPEETAASFTEDGFLKTGDAGEIDEYGNLYITDRLKELMKTSNGKYIAPQYIEGKIGKDKFIEQIAVVADAKKYVSALVVPSFEALEDLAEQLNIKYQDRLELIKNSEIIQFFETRINELQKELAHFEQVKKFTLLSEEFSAKMEEITPTLKLRRKVILERYKHHIEEMYNEYFSPNKKEEAKNSEENLPKEDDKK
ncbi:AMP-dependent synthetase/ligase [Phocoenobacter skyensis]|uniref:Long-chain acyl-CoA synthetase n=1 Tax=Phocoenobacter skyensis TaxID=97481 RepID=A0A1H7XV40_9PAST|nr:long-chain fatty acid--CoA ligase [Pasteurella skyensis]MDP8078426.1 long-chain fatty acid--CoA ligase [Pasteurella skyensis]MDP8084482.1 long-chain fatty acid--CoA ligase [Pasteurella skyensis]MDP8184451.1 long-chain fatty acid--CoA ligase [Pasteurella skyensis]QLB23283.1 long-chain fatty acid--CoA ligase [Pasteurella skyensis]SEM36859.1 long-chain acyl-CoA synthetase [Pasteurella skyensis]